LLYTQLISLKDNDFTATVAHSEEEAGFEHVCDFNETKSSENANNNRYKTFRALGISVINVVVDRGGFEPPTS
jgi:hypothetical protein